MANPTILSSITPQPSEKTLYITIGNEILGDDGVGPYIARKLGNTPKNIVVLDAGTKPENAIDSAIECNPCKTIIFDTADFGGEPGEIAQIDEEHLCTNILSTHRFPVQAISKIITEDTGCTTIIIGIQPQQTIPGNGLSDPVKKSAEIIIKSIKEGIINA